MSSGREEPALGALFLREIREQPLALERLLDHEDAFRAAGEALRRRPPAVVRMVGHGSSDNAASFGVYAFGLLPGWTAVRDSISLSVYYGARIDLAGSCVLALSQSGRTPDVVEYVSRARARGALTIAVTNDADSSLAEAAEIVLPLAAGEERAVAATKTYTTQLAALALLAAHACDEGRAYADGIRATAALLSDLLPELEPRVADAARALTFAERLFSIGRGPEFATAREFALKLLETCRVAAEPFTATDFSHGPGRGRRRALPGLGLRLRRRRAADRPRGGRPRQDRGRDGDRRRDARRRARRRRLPARRPRAAAAAALAVAFDRPGTARRPGARAGTRARRRSSRRSQQGHARPLTAVVLATSAAVGRSRAPHGSNGREYYALRIGLTARIGPVSLPRVRNWSSPIWRET